MVCPICVAKSNDSKPKGDDTWGYSSHLHNKHGPPQVEHGNPHLPTYAFALVVCQHPETKKFLLVREGCNQGWWLPGGRVDPGETFQQAGIRETIEEAGVDVELKGLLAVEYSPYPDGGARQRIIFYAQPKDPKAIPKQIPDFESQGAEWISFEEMVEDLKSKKKHLRGSEPYKWFKYVSEGKPIHSITLLQPES